jgi:tetratricopeptide (TPR) repeat protein
VLSGAAFGLRAQGRFAEALPAMRAALTMYETAKQWYNAAVQAYNLSEAELLVGNVAAAVSLAQQSVDYADRSDDEFEMIVSRATYADALHAAGQGLRAADLFARAEQRQTRLDGHPVLYAMPGYRYCDLLLGKWEHAAAHASATKASLIARKNNWLLNIALDTLIIGRAHLGRALSADASLVITRRHDVQEARRRLDQAVDDLRSAGASHHIPRGLLARAVFRRCGADWQGATSDLREVEEIADIEPLPMRLYLCDMALEYARLALAQIEAFAPLNGILERGNLPKPTVPRSGEIVRLKAEAERQLKTAGDHVTKCGYHRRDRELAELQEVLAGKKRFGELPSRV